MALIQAVIKDHCAPYAIDSQGECGLTTEGDSQILGRTVPAYLQVTGIAGKITGGVAYRAKPVEFILPPLFEVVACAANSNTDKCNELPSYTGEFAKGLELEDSLTFSVINDPENQLEISNANGDVTFDKNSVDKAIAGTHTIQLTDNYKFVFKKEAPKKAEFISQKLKLSINIENDAVLAGEGTAGLAEDANLRFGFLTLEDTDLDIDGFSLEKPGEMKTTLNYYDTSVSDIQQVVQNNDHKYNLSGLQSKVEALSEGQRPNLVVAEKVVKVTPAASPTEWQGNVSIELTGPDYVWLKPYDDNKKQLSNPQGRLTISGRKRGNDRVFNRREALQ